MSMCVMSMCVCLCAYVHVCMSMCVCLCVYVYACIPGHMLSLPLDVCVEFGKEAVDVSAEVSQLPSGVSYRLYSCMQRP